MHEDPRAVWEAELFKPEAFKVNGNQHRLIISCSKHDFKGDDWEGKFDFEKTKKRSRKNLLGIQYSFG